jgi:vancomycin resistance protein YoaR
MIAKRNVAAGYDAENEKIIAGLQDKTGLSQRRAKDASISFRDGQFFITPEAAGEKINETKLLADLQGNLKNLESNPITIELESETPGISAAQLEAGKNKIGDKLKNQITLKYAGGKIKFKPLDHLDAVRLAEKTEIELGSGGISLPYEIAGQDAALNQDSPLKVVHKIEAEIIPQKIDSYLQENLVKDIEIPTSPVTITQNADGKITIEGKGEDGKTVHKERLIAAINRAINNGIPTVKVPVVIEKAPVNVSKNLQDLGIKQLLATGYTTYYGSAPNRRHNINLGISKYNGLLIKPGEEFSFNTILGNVDGSTGYLQEKVIKKNKIELEYGGGICQVSSTLYRAILFAGLPVTERNPHSWKVSYYSQVLGDGLDATIYPGVSDVKFINDTPASLVMQAYAEGSAAYFKFYGTSDGRAVTLQGPFGGGLNYKWYRIINKNGQETKETIISNYKPIPPPDPPAPKPVVAQTPPLKPTI